MKKHLLSALSLILATGMCYGQAPKNMVLVPGGTIETSYGAKETVKPFYIDKYEVVIADFKKFVDATGYVTQGEKQGEGTITGGKAIKKVDWKCNVWGKPVPEAEYAQAPVLYLCHKDMEAYCKGAGKRLPTEAEWEHAFREGKNSTFKYSGSNNGKLVAVSEDFGAVDAQHLKVGTKAPNALGIYDMSGNVPEFCENGSEYVVIKGGSFVDDKSLIQCVRNSQLIPKAVATQVSWYSGFRCAKDIK